MATAGEHFALDWIKGDLLETLNEARVALDDFAEMGGEETRLRTCLTGLHQVHGTLVMLEFEGVTLLADYLEQLAQAMHDGRIADTAGAGQALMQGILELPGYLDDLQSGGADDPAPFLPLVNEIRGLMDMAPLADPSAGALTQVASDEVIRRFEAIDGAGKVARIRSAYQNVLLHILKGQDRSSAVTTLSKIALGLAKVCEGAPLEQQWLAFGEFIGSLGREQGALETEAVKLLRRIDVEIKDLARHGSEVLKQPVNLELIAQLLDAATARDHSSDTIDDLQQALQSSSAPQTMSLSGRQALSSAAQVLREDLALVKDKLDLMVRSSSLDLEQLRQLITPLKQIGSTLSLLGFESSREIVADQLEAIDKIVVLEDSDPQAAAGIVAALGQLDENLSSAMQGGAVSEVEQITTDAQRQLVVESRKGLEEIKQSVVDFVTTHWSTGHLGEVPGRLSEICGALRVIPLTRVIDILTAVRSYVVDLLMKGHQPDWQELDRFADVISAVDYYLERLGEDVNSGSEEILSVAQRSLAELQQMAQATELASDAAVQSEEVTPAVSAEQAAQDVDATLEELFDDQAEDEQPLQTAQPELEPKAAPSMVEEPVIELPTAGETGEVSLELEADDAFDLSSGLFDELDEADSAADVADTAEQLAQPDEQHSPEDSVVTDAHEAHEVLSVQTESDEDDEDEVRELGMASAVGATDHDTTPAMEPPDPEIVEIFVEEVGEVLETLHEYVPQWARELAVDDALTEVRRAFHTLKGSGRIVQAAVIGELAWCVENMLNRVIDGTVTPTPQFVRVIEDACALIPGLRDEFAVGRNGDVDAVSVVVEHADILASGGEIPGLEAPSMLEAQQPAVLEASVDAQVEVRAEEKKEAPLQEPTDGQLQPPAFSDDFQEDAGQDSGDIAYAASDMIEWEPTTVADSNSADLSEDLPDEDMQPSVTEEPADLLLEPSAEETPTLEFDTELPDLDDLAAMIGADAQESGEDSVSQLSGDAAPADHESDMDLFVEEVQECLDTLAEAGKAEPWVLSDALARIYHTLVGSAALAQADTVKLVVEPADQVAEFFRAQPPTAELQNFFAQAERHLRDFVEAYRDGRIWDEPLEFVALADDLIAGRAATGRPIQQLLDAPVTEAVFEVETDMGQLLAGQAEHLPQIVRVFDDMVAFARNSSELNMTPMADLAGALAARLGALPAEGFGQPDNVAASTVLQRGYDRLIDQLNELAGGSSPVTDPQLLQDIANVSFTVSVETFEEPDLQSMQADLSDAEQADAEQQLHSPVDEQPADEVEQVAASEAASASQQSQPDIDLSDVDDDLIQVFFEEAEEISEDLENSVLTWERERDNRIHLENMLRSLHTLKGGARLCGLAQLGDQVHDFESMLIEVQNGTLEVDDALLAQVQQRYDEITGYLGQVQALYTGTPAPSAAEAPAQPAATPAEEVSAAQMEPVSDADEQSAIVHQLHGNKPEERKLSKPDAPQTPPSTPAVERQPQEMVRVSSGLLEQLVNLAGESSILRARIEQGMSDFAGALDEMETTIERLREQLRRLEIETETQVLYRHERADGPAYDQFDPLEMDRYNQIQQLSRGLSESASDMLDLKETLLFKSRESETLLLQQARINTELQEGLMRTRMVPFSRLLPRLRRIVRQVASELNKEVELHVQNAEGELDRNLLERMLPPLEHMLRNAVDHGIEDPQLRRSHGKSSAGRIDLRLTREGGDVVIEIIDDGAGIDVETVRAKAVERGLMSADTLLSDEDVLQFVLAAGFSTAQSVTQISGRGVGLDVVNSEVKQLGGSVSIASSPGKGSRFVVRVPFTVSVNRALMVSIGDDQYAIPLNTIEGIVLLSPEQLQALYSGQSKSFEYAGVPYRVRYLGQYLGREYQPGGVGTQSSVPMVLVRSGDHAVAIHVDQVQGSREIVVKSLGPQFAGVGGISGATIFGDGSVVVILDLLALIRAQQSRSVRMGKQAVKAERRGPTRVMVVDDSVTVRKVTSRLLERQGMDVLVAKDGIEAVALLQEQRPDIMLLDIEMPRMDGFEVARQVRRDDRLTSLPIVMISSRTGEKHKEHASELGVNKFLGKPFQENELLATIDELVTGS